jgi:hypothetical protein
MKQEIPKEIKDLFNAAGQKYADSPATTNAGRVLRFFARFITVETVVKILAHKLK